MVLNMKLHTTFFYIFDWSFSFCFLPIVFKLGGGGGGYVRLFYINICAYMWIKIMCYHTGSSSSKLCWRPDPVDGWSHSKRGKSGSLHWQTVGHCLWHILEQCWCSGGLQTARVYIIRYVVHWVHRPVSCVSCNVNAWSSPYKSQFKESTNIIVLPLCNAQHGCISDILNVDSPSPWWNQELCVYRDEQINLALLCVGAQSFANARFGRGNGPLLLDRLRCTGREQYLLNCSHSGVGVTSYYCGHDDDAGVRCQGNALSAESDDM